jgi:transposase
MGKHKSEDYKLSAVNYYTKSHNQMHTCKIFNCNERSLMRWVNKYNHSNNITRKKRKSVSYKINQEHIAFIKKEIFKNKTITMQDLTAQIYNKFRVQFSRSHIASVVKDLNISLKQTKLRHEPVTRWNKPINIHNSISDFYQNIKQYDINDIISIDETSLNAYEVRKKCYNDIGKRCVIKTHSQEVFKKYTGIFAISTTGVIGYEIYDKGGIDSNRLVDFLNKYITTKYSNKLIILDNASSHRNQNVKHEITANNNLLYAVPYQHFTNVIEGYFSVLKSKLRKQQGIGLHQLKQNISNIIDEIPKSTYKRLFEGSYNRTKKYQPKVSTHKHTLKNYKKSAF